jgi:hypothetical protein
VEEKKKFYKIVTWTNFQRGKKFSEKKEGEKQSLNEPQRRVTSFPSLTNVSIVFIVTDAAAEWSQTSILILV